MMGVAQSNPSASSRFSDALARVRQRFVQSIPERLEEIGCQFERISDGEDLADCLHGIERELHKIAGIAGSIGLPELGEKSARTEAKLISELTGDINAAAVEKLFEAIVELTQDLQRVHATEAS
mmetsp:Transcript_6697/g.11718  ORF Transcript_6697/g.11718 Transcript_6697/m.11718 type:complete len:124 (-) Transcript_6697:80-451(-)